MDSLTVNFGKYKSQSIADIYEKDERYCKWLFTQEILIGELPAIKEFLFSKFNGTDLSYVMTWGRNKGKSINWINQNDKSYIKWLLTNQFVADHCKTLRNELIALTSDA